MNSNKIGEVGVRFCASCEHNIKCVECSIKAENENLLRSYEALIEKHRHVCAEADKLKLALENERAATRELKRNFNVKEGETLSRYE